MLTLNKTLNKNKMIEIILTTLSLPFLTLLIGGLVFLSLCSLDELKSKLNKQEGIKLALYELFCLLSSTLLSILALVHQSDLLFKQITNL